MPRERVESTRRTFQRRREVSRYLVFVQDMGRDDTSVFRTGIDFETIRINSKGKSKSSRKRREGSDEVEAGQGVSVFRFLLFFGPVESERARGKSGAQFLHGLLRFKVDLRAGNASRGFDHRQPKKVNDQ